MASQPQQLPLNPAQVNRSRTAQWRQFMSMSLDDLRCSSPAFLTEDYDPTTGGVTVQIGIQERVRTLAGAKWYDLPPIQLVPVVLPAGGGFSTTFPLKKGDEGHLIFCDACIDNWFRNGQNNAPPADNLDEGASASGSQIQFEVRRHDFWDCGFHPGMKSVPNLVPNYSTTAVQIRKNDGSLILEVNTSTVQVKTAANSPLKLVNDNFYQWFVNTFMESVQYVGSPPSLPTNPETSAFESE